MHPGVEPIRLAKAGQLAPRVHEGVLHGVFRVLAIAEDEERNPVETVADGRRKGLKGLVLSVPRRFHDIAPHRLLLDCVADLAALAPYDAACTPNVQRLAGT